MDDLISRLSADELAELSALADGTLPFERRAAVEARVSASPELQELVERQRQALAATQTLSSQPAPASLRAAVDARLRSRPAGPDRARRLVPGLALGGAAALAAVIALVVALSGGPGGPSVADAARLAVRPPTGPAPARLQSSSTELAARVDGVVFPDLRRSYGWKPVGIRRGRIDGRSVTVVYYAWSGRRIAYAIVSGSGLPQPSGGHVTLRRGVEYRSLAIGDLHAVTWRRLGHTCVLVGAVRPAALLTLASWHGGGSLRY